MKPTSVAMKNRRGSALVTVLAVILLLAVVSGALVTLARQQAFTAQRTRDYLKAQLIAEAGVNAAYSILKTNFALCDNPANFPATNFGDGRYDAEVVRVSSNQASIVATGWCGHAEAVARADIKNYPRPETNRPPLTSPWAFGLFCNGYVTYNGSSRVRGAVHVNNYLRANGSINWGSATNPVYVECSGATGFEVNGNCTVQGTVRAPRISVTGGKTITEERVQSVPTIPLPALDLTAYYNTALANGQVFSSLTVNGHQNWGTIPGGVRWINGTLRVNGGGSITYQGCVIATGGITLNGGCTQTKVEGLPALVSRDGAIEINGAHTMYGLVYAGSDVRFNGSGSIEGTVMAGGNITFNGAAVVDLGYAYSEPLGSRTVTDRVVVTAWQD